MCQIPSEKQNLVYVNKPNMKLVATILFLTLVLAFVEYFAPRENAILCRKTFWFNFKQIILISASKIFNCDLLNAFFEWFEPEIRFVCFTQVLKFQKSNSFISLSIFIPFVDCIEALTKSLLIKRSPVNRIPVESISSLKQ